MWELQKTCPRVGLLNYQLYKSLPVPGEGWGFTLIGALNQIVYSPENIPSMAKHHTQHHMQYMTQ